MTIEDFKELVENGSIDNQSYIFVYEDVPFVCEQYIHKIVKDKNRELVNISSISELPQKSIFDVDDDNFSYILRTDSFDELPNIENLYVVTKKCSSKKNVINIPKLEEWHIKDYCYSICSGCEDADLNTLISVCNGNIYRIQSELEKLLLFTPDERKFLLKQEIEDGAYSDISNLNIFNFKDYIMNHNGNGMISIFKQLQACDIEPLGLVTILYKEFRKLILCMLHPNPNSQNTGLSDKLIYATKKYAPKGWSKKDLVDAFDFLSQIQYKLVTGELEEKYIVDYVFLYLMSL